MCAVNSCDEYYAGAHMLASHQQGLIGDWHTAALGHMITMHHDQRGRISAAASVRLHIAAVHCCTATRVAAAGGHHGASAAVQLMLRHDTVTPCHRTRAAAVAWQQAHSFGDTQAGAVQQAQRMSAVAAKDLHRRGPLSA